MHAEYSLTLLLLYRETHFAVPKCNHGYIDTVHRHHTVTNTGTQQRARGKKHNPKLFNKMVKNVT